MNNKVLLDLLNDWAPLAYAESFDNVGIIVGRPENEVTGIIVALDCLESVVNEALDKKCNTIVCFHPIIFDGLKSLTGSNYVERVVEKAIQHQISIIAMHTALDNCPTGVNDALASGLGLQNASILLPKSVILNKLTTYVPVNDLEKVREALFAAGAGALGNYDRCSFANQGTGTFRGNPFSNPTIGKPGEWESVPEVQLHVSFQEHLRAKVLKSLFEAHPYETVSYEVVKMENKYNQVGMGMIGLLPQSMTEMDFLKHVKERLSTPAIRHSELLGKPIRKVAVLGGSGAFSIAAALRQGADALVTADLKYHDFFKAENRILLIDAGHYETEAAIKSKMFDYLTKKIPNFAIVLSDANTNPVKYF